MAFKIKAGLVGLVLSTAIGCSNCSTTKEINKLPKVNDEYYQQLEKEAEKDTLQLTLQDLIDIPVYFSINHFYMNPLHPTDTTNWNLFGYTAFEKQQILINDNTTLNIRRLILLHEYYHIINYYARPRMHFSEDEITARAYNTFKKLYPEEIIDSKKKQRDDAIKEIQKKMEEKMREN